MKSNFSGYTLANIILLESQFKRGVSLHFDKPDFENKVQVNVEHELKGDENEYRKLYVIVSLSMKGGKDGQSDIETSIKMMGVFGISEDSTVDPQVFAKNNGPAIVYPFIREHLANLTMKAGITPILLPPLNFTKFEGEKENIHGTPA